MSKYLISSLSLIGGRKEQQDAYGVIESPHGFLVVVCDGMGGGKAGNVASKMAVKIIIDSFLNYGGNQPIEGLRHAINIANTDIYNLSNSDEDFQGMGTTLAVLLISKQSATSLHVGDSRVYQIKQGKKYFRTFDHSKVFELVKLGVLTEEQARLSSDSNIILRALGIKPVVDIEINLNLPYEKNDRFLVCTDGVSGAISEEELIQIISESKSLEETNIKLTNTVDLIGKQNGNHHDNLTSVLLETKNNSKLKTPINMKSKIIIISLIIALLLSNVFSIYNHMKFSKLLSQSKLINDSLLTIKKDKPNSNNDTDKITHTPGNIKIDKGGNSTQIQSGEKENKGGKKIPTKDFNKSTLVKSPDKKDTSNGKNAKINTPINNSKTTNQNIEKNTKDTSNNKKGGN
jgi:protein phosphatase